MKGLLSRLFKGENETKTAPPKPSASEPIVIVSGLPRSGTSLMMRMLEAGGIPVMVDHLRTADTDNPNGYYELERVKKLPAGDVAWLNDATGKVVKVISYLLNTLPDKHRYRVVFMERNLSEVLASQKKMLVNREESTDELSDEKATELFTAHLRQIKRWLNEQANMQTCFVDYGKMINDPESQIHTINALFEGQLDVAAMLSVVDPNLYRNRSG